MLMLISQIELVPSHFRSYPDVTHPTALERATYSTKSFLTAFALVSGHLTADEAAKVALVEVQSQIDLWGEVEDCECGRCFGASLDGGM